MGTKLIKFIIIKLLLILIKLFIGYVILILYYNIIKYIMNMYSDNSGYFFYFVLISHI